MDSWLELNIGLMCACVPSVSVAVEMMRKRGRSPVPSMAPPHQVLRFRTKRKELERDLPASLPTFDSELAMWSRDDTFELGQSTVSKPVTTNGRCKRINSNDGRQEGWLKTERTVY